MARSKAEVAKDIATTYAECKRQQDNLANMGPMLADEAVVEAVDQVFIGWAKMERLSEEYEEFDE